MSGASFPRPANYGRSLTRKARRAHRDPSYRVRFSRAEVAYAFRAVTITSKEVRRAFMHLAQRVTEAVRAAKATTATGGPPSEP